MSIVTEKFIPSKVFLFLDTETNGLPRDFKIAPIHHQFWPEIVSIAWEQYNLDTTIVPYKWTLTDQQYFVVKPSSSTIKWNKESEAIHKITLEEASAGVDISTALNLFDDALARSDYIVAHNLSFDRSVIQAAMHRAKRKTVWVHTGDEICSMMNTIKVVKIPRHKPIGDDRYKWPKLSELHFFLFKDEYKESTLHNSLADTQCLVKCYKELLNRGLLTV
jgi:DNA polymerase III epsilon subunit-like protein